MDYIISPSVMCMDLMNLGEQIKTLNKHVSMYHVDFIDCLKILWPDSSTTEKPWNCSCRHRPTKPD